jgi:hypothetical protein
MSYFTDRILECHVRHGQRPFALGVLESPDSQIPIRMTFENARTNQGWASPTERTVRGGTRRGQASTRRTQGRCQPRQETTSKASASSVACLAWLFASWAAGAVDEARTVPQMMAVTPMAPADDAMA